MKDLRNQFIDFARAKSPSEQYDYWSTKRCACGQLAEHLGFGGEDRLMLERKFGKLAAQRPRNWGALADRLEV